MKGGCNRALSACQVDVVGFDGFLFCCVSVVNLSISISIML